MRHPFLLRLAGGAVNVVPALLLLAALPVAAQAPTHPLAEVPQRGDISYIWTMPRWSPYAAGIGIGIVSWLAFLLSKHPLGVSTAYARSCGMLEKLFRGRKVNERAYYREYPPVIDWEWMLVLGLLLGAAAAAYTSGSFAWQWVPGRWEAAFGHTPVAHVLTGLAGGVLVGLGARWAGGCTSGHGISGTLQLVVSSWLAALCFFAGGVAAALTLYHGFG